MRLLQRLFEEPRYDDVAGVTSGSRTAAANAARSRRRLALPSTGGIATHGMASWSPAARTPPASASASSHR